MLALEVLVCVMMLCSCQRGSIFKAFPFKRVVCSTKCESLVGAHAGSCKGKQRFLMVCLMHNHHCCLAEAGCS